MCVAGVVTVVVMWEEAEGSQSAFTMDTRAILAQ